MFEQALDPRAVLLIKELAQQRMFSDTFYLAGGTALSLHLGHRRSEDVDLFSQEQFSVEHYSNFLTSIEGHILIAEQGTVHCVANNVKLSLLYYPYPLLNSPTTYRDLNVASVEDIACMKSIAISQRAEKKDFFDLVEILRIIPPQQLKQMLFKKFGHKKINCYHILKSFFYFSDVDHSPDPVSLNGTTWSDIKQYLLSHEKEISSAFLTDF